MDTGSANIILETKTVLPVTRIIWRSVRYQSTVTFVYSDGEVNGAIEEDGKDASCQESANSTSATSE